MKYRADIDGLRAISVLAVIFYHIGLFSFSGGFVGVDVFFVISGYLISYLIYSDIKNNKFSFKRFYLRRAARLLPALCVTLLFALIFGFIFYSNAAFDNFGKELFFSVLGAANILYAQGVDYFASNSEVKPLIHLWSLGVEEQFYLLWPTILIFAASLRGWMFFTITVGLFLASLIASILAASNDKMAAYYMLHYRAFELMVGALIALALIEKKLPTISSVIFKELFSIIGLLMIIIPIFVFDSTTLFPGYNALIPCVGAGMIIFNAGPTMVARVLETRVLVFVGLISYPLYLVHQPIISYINYFDLSVPVTLKIVLVFALSIFISWVIYQFAEKPFRNAIRHNNNVSIKIASAVSFMMILGLCGLWIAKDGGLTWRFKLLNPFAYDISLEQESSFHANFPRGVFLQSENPRILFVGDSVLQQYVVPIAMAYDVELTDVDTVTRGGCVLLKGVEFEDKVSDISCDAIRASLYQSNKKYDLVVFSQLWSSYDDQIKNSVEKYGAEKYTSRKWNVFIEGTIRHFEPLSKKIILIGGHVDVQGTQKLTPSIMLNEHDYDRDVQLLKINNIDYLTKTKKYFEKYGSNTVGIIHPVDLWCGSSNDNCTLAIENRSVFTNSNHFSSAATEFLSNRVKP